MTTSGPGRRRPRTSLAVRVTLLVIAVAVLVAAVASVVGVLVVRRTLIDVTAEALADRANVIAAQTSTGTDGLSAAASVLAEQGITVVLIGPDGEFSDVGRAADLAAAEAGAHQAVAGRSISGSAIAGGRLQLVEARSTTAGGFALVAPADVAAATRQALERRLLWAILAGTVAALMVGVLVARAVSAPLRRTAELARAMGAGARDLRAPVAGPREVADLSEAVNGLADALQHSESRQRRFLTSVSHELRTPLAGITGQAQALVDGLVAPEEQVEVGRSIGGEAARLDRLVSDLLDLARLGADSFPIDLAPTDLGALVTEMAGVWQVRCAARGVPLVVDVPGDAAAQFRPAAGVDRGSAAGAGRGSAAGVDRGFAAGVDRGFAAGAARGSAAGADDRAARGVSADSDTIGTASVVAITDARRVRQVLEVLADNSLRVLEPGRPLVLHVGREAEGAVLQVRDGGPGLAAEDWAVAFEPGVLHERYRGRRPGGAGLGLALAHSLVLRLGGSIVAAPAPEGGVAMTVRLPDNPRLRAG